MRVLHRFFSSSNGSFWASNSNLKIVRAVMHHRAVKDDSQSFKIYIDIIHAFLGLFFNSFLARQT